MKKLCFVYLMFFASFLFANVGSITTLKGDVSITRENKTFDAKLNDKLEKSDSIETKANSIAVITLLDNTQITIGKNSSVNIEDYLFDENESKNSKANFNFFKGTFKSVTGKIGKLNPKKFKLKTKSASIGIRGTTVLGNQEKILVLEGSIFLTSNSKQVIVDAKQFSDTSINNAPSTPKSYTNNELDELLKEFYIDKKIISFTTQYTKDKNNILSLSAKNGNVVKNEDGSITYSIDKNYVGEDTVTITSSHIDETKVETVKIKITKDDKFELALTDVSIKDFSTKSIKNIESAYVNIHKQINNISNTITAPSNNFSLYPLTSWTVPSSGLITPNLTSTREGSSANIDGSYLPSSSIGTSFTMSSGSQDFQIGGSSMAIQSYYFVNEDQFGVIDNTGNAWAQAIYDDIDATGNYVSKDNSVSWGYMTNGTIDGVWVAGDLGSNFGNFTINTNLNLSGHIIGYISNKSTGAISNILYDNNNSINININVGSATTGDFNFNTSNNQNWNGILSGATINSGATASTLDLVIVSGTGGGEAMADKTITSQLYGSGSTVKSVGGTIEIETSSNAAAAVFIAD